MKKMVLAAVALSLGLATVTVQARNETKGVSKVVLTDGPEPSCLPDCGDPAITSDDASSLSQR